MNRCFAAPQVVMYAIRRCVFIVFLVVACGLVLAPHGLTPTLTALRGQSKWKSLLEGHDDLLTVGGIAAAAFAAAAAASSIMAANDGSTADLPR